MKFCDRIFLLMGLLSSIGSCLNAQANVSLKNGNFFIAYTDVVYTGGYETRLQLVYNSKSSFIFFTCFKRILCKNPIL